MPVPTRLVWPVWRLVLRQVATLQEVEEHYSMADVLLANDAIDLQDEVDRLAQERSARR